MSTNVIWQKRRRNALNLDNIFGEIFYNVPGDTISPIRIATLYLLRILFETHFGTRRVPSPRPLTVAEKRNAFLYLLPLMLHDDEDISYEDFRTYVRYYYRQYGFVDLDFYAAMEHIGCGATDVVIAVPDEFYTNKHSRQKDIFGRFMFPHTYDPDQNALPFSSSQSFMYRWLKRLLAQAAKTTVTQMFNVNHAMRRWINSTRNEKFFRELPMHEHGDIPLYLSTSMRSRFYINEYMRHIQANAQTNAVDDNRYRHIAGLLKGCRIIAKRHKDVHTVHILEALCHLTKQNGEKAVAALKKYFDFSQFILTDDMGHAMRTHRLTVLNTLPLLYGPILQARVCRLLGDPTQAKQLLEESIQQSQLKNDETCHQLANLEMHILEIIGSSPLLEDKEEEHIHVEPDRRIHKKGLKNLNDLHHQFFVTPCCSQTTEDFEVCSMMDSIGKMMMILKNIAKGEYQLHLDQVIETGMLNPVSTDFEERGIQVYAYGNSIVTSNMIRNGMYKQAQELVHTMMTSNTSELFFGGYLNETWAVALSNLVYSYAGRGLYDKAHFVLDDAIARFPSSRMWQGSQHFKICKAVIRFEQSFRLNELEACAEALTLVRNFSMLEFKIRLALLMAAQGNEKKAIDELLSIKTVDVRGRVRILMQLAMVHIKTASYELAERNLNEAIKIADGTTFLDLHAMAVRRRATLFMVLGKSKECLNDLMSCFDAICSCGSFTEKCCLYLTAIRSLRESGIDPRQWIKFGRALVSGDKWPGMDMMYLTELAFLHAPGGLVPDESKYAHVVGMFAAKLDPVNKNRCHWLLI